MMKFASFENIVAAIYNYLPGVKSDYSKGAQTAVAFTGGYLAGILCAIVSHPADVMVSKLNAERKPGESFGGAMSRIYSKIGFTGLWNGLPVRIVSVPSVMVEAVLIMYAGHDWYAHWSPMDDLRRMQDLLWSANNRWRQRAEEARLDGTAARVSHGVSDSRDTIAPKNVHPISMPLSKLSFAYLKCCQEVMSVRLLPIHRLTDSKIDQKRDEAQLTNQVEVQGADKEAWQSTTLSGSRENE